MFQECHVAQGEGVVNLAQPRSSSTVAWHKPGVGSYKCNLDAAINSASGRNGFGMCVRNHARRFIMSHSLSTQPLLAPHEGEAFLLLMVLHWLQSHTL